MRERERVCVWVWVCVPVCIPVDLWAVRKILPTLLLLLLLRTSFGPDLDPILPRFCIHLVKYLVTYFREDTLYTKKKNSNSNSNNTNTARYVPNVGKVGKVDIEGTS